MINPARRYWLFSFPPYETASFTGAFSGSFATIDEAKAEIPKAAIFKKQWACWQLPGDSYFYEIVDSLTATKVLE